MEVTPNPTAIQTASTPPVQTNDRDALSSDFETFITMLTVQMENQDPLNPLDSQDFATQLATFSGVEQQVKTNELLDTLNTQFLSSSLGDMASWVGMNARLAAPAHFDGEPISIVANPPSFAERSELVVYNDQGIEVQRSSIPVSDDEISWDGTGANGTTLASGTYSFEVIAYSNDEIIDVHTPDLFTEVLEVRSIDGQAVIATEGGHLHPASIVSGLR
ncbi:flagellar basal-body rod modification protein FlgD [Litoreibacter ponti]|uniref:Basal-body rod modification protein FlgD n=1 Tax=Litoreibacter ponti TaxID=1510457 RepID=A0A2T6BNG7_9RHOB|nr:flagellar hook capping FlgD N-terminal domain-containing protein [Litoreibacter ponti]PTX57586.1 flagellar basal-body rod modification protein FlgD [Litoreibacter ponti]